MTGSGPPSGVADAIVVAAGSSSRMAGIDKVLAPIGGRPLLAWTLEAMLAAPEVDGVVVVVAEERFADVVNAAWLPARVTQVVPGGPRRQDSVRAGIDALERVRADPAGERIVLVHDGARPVVDGELIGRVVVAAARHGAAIPVLPVVETVKRVRGAVVETTVDRTELVVAQTPQGIRRGVFRTALAVAAELPGGSTWTDEAALLEACRIPVHVVAGAPGNTKVTVPADLAEVTARLVGGGDVRTGIGIDAHPFGPGSPLQLGGLSFPGAPRLAGHSDGDVALHAVADALLGAAALGDLGRLAPADDRTPVGIDSRALLDAVVVRLGDHGWRPVSVDLTITAARPRLGGRLDEMAGRIATRLGLDPDRVSVKASTGNLDGSAGAGRGISALAVATIERRP